MIFLFKWQNNKGYAPSADENADHVFFANQVINNACATQAILSILLNRDDIELGEELKNFKEFTADFPPDVRLNSKECNQKQMLTLFSIR